MPLRSIVVPRSADNRFLLVSTLSNTEHYLCAPVAQRALGRDLSGKQEGQRYGRVQVAACTCSTTSGQVCCQFRFLSVHGKSAGPAATEPESNMQMLSRAQSWLWWGLP